MTIELSGAVIVAAFGSLLVGVVGYFLTRRDKAIDEAVQAVENKLGKVTEDVQEIRVKLAGVEARCGASHNRKGGSS